MATKADKYLLILFAAMVSADASPAEEGRSGVSLDKKHRMDQILQERFPTLDGAARWALVGKAMRGLPKIKRGRDFISVVEKSSQNLADNLTGGRKEAFGIVKMLADVAESDGVVSGHERLVLQATINHIGLKGMLDVRVKDNSISIRRRSS